MPQLTFTRHVAALLVVFLVALALALWLASWAVCEAGAQLAPKDNPAFDVLHYNPLLHLSSFVVGIAAALAMKRHGAVLAAMPGMRQAGAFALWSCAVTVIVIVFVAHDWLVRTTGPTLPTDRGCWPRCSPSSSSASRGTHRGSRTLGAGRRWSRSGRRATRSTSSRCRCGTYTGSRSDA